MVTTFVINQTIERGGTFPTDDISTLCRMAGWAENSGVRAIYVKDVLDRYMDTSCPLKIGLFVLRFTMFYELSLTCLFQ